MNDPRQFSDELLSAYYDGETSPEETAAVDALLAESSAARNQLGDYQRLSAIIKPQFPVAELPIDLAACTLQKLESRRNDRPAATAHPTVAVKSVSYRREWLAAISALAVSAATLLLVVRSNPPGIPFGTPAAPGHAVALRSSESENLAHHANRGLDLDANSAIHHEGIAFTTPEPEGVRAKVAREVDTFSDQTDPSFKSAHLADAQSKTGHPRAANELKRDELHKNEALVADAPARSATKPMASPSAPSTGAPSAAAPTVTRPLNSTRAMKAGSAESAASQEKAISGKKPADSEVAKQPSASGVGGAMTNLAAPLSDLAGQNRLRVGDVVPYLATAEGNTVGIVELTVVDIDRTLGEISVLLQRNTVSENKLAESKEVVIRKGTAMALADKAGLAPQLQALYLEASSEQLRVAFNEMDDRGLLLNARLQPPITVEEVSYANGWNDQPANQPHALDAISVANTMNYRLNSPLTESNSYGPPSQATVQNRPLAASAAAGTNPNPALSPKPALNAAANANQNVPSLANSTGPGENGAQSNDARQSANPGYFQRLELQMNRRNDAGKNSNFNAVDRARALNDGSRQSQLPGTPGTGTSPAPNSGNALGVNNFAGNRADGQKLPDLVRMVLLLQKQSR